MKHILLLIILINNAYSDVRIAITNNVSGVSYGAEFKTIEKMTEWKNKQISEKSWGLPSEYTITETDITSERLTRVSLKNIQKDMNFGKNLYAKVRLIMKQKELTKKQRKDMRSALGSIRDDLFDGDICSAKDDIAAITPTAVISQANLDHVISLIDAYKVCEL